MPLEYALRQMHDAMEMVFEYDRDGEFVPSADQLLMFELLRKQVVGYDAMLLIIIGTMRERAKVATSAEIVKGLKMPPE